jgi:hypothetical protein
MGWVATAKCHVLGFETDRVGFGACPQTTANIPLDGSISSFATVKRSERPARGGRTSLQEVAKGSKSTGSDSTDTIFVAEGHSYSGVLGSGGRCRGDGAGGASSSGAGAGRSRGGSGEGDVGGIEGTAVVLNVSLASSLASGVVWVVSNTLAVGLLADVTWHGVGIVLEAWSGAVGAGADVVKAALYTYSATNVLTDTSEF